MQKANRILIDQFPKLNVAVMTSMMHSNILVAIVFCKRPVTQWFGLNNVFDPLQLLCFYCPKPPTG